jgi:hypothetical protein
MYEIHAVRKSAEPHKQCNSFMSAYPLAERMEKKSRKKKDHAYSGLNARGRTT